MAAKSEAVKSQVKVFRKDSWPKKLFLIPGLLLIFVGLSRYFLTVNHVINDDLVTCGGVSQKLSRAYPLVRQEINQSCYSMVLIAPSAKSMVAVTPKKTADVCFWRKNRCVAWMHIKDRGIVEMTNEEIPRDYSAILLKGDPGEAVISLYR